MRAKLQAAFAPEILAIEDESSRHAGHSGAREGGESHFRVRIVSAAFKGLGRVERQRRVYAVVAEEIEAGLHALALTTLTPEEAERS
ncbi:MAG TPA: BolA family protein [Micropepsaceae bacterium]|nr:BolA family protein [Micropepsaceae bacterium]